MSKEFLVTYATKSGSTADVAGFIGQTLYDVGAKTVVKPVDLVKEIAEYEAVFIGSPIINGKCMPEIKKFVSIHTPHLSEKTVAYFITCMRLSQVSGGTAHDIPVFVDPVFGNPRPKREMTFPEKVHPVTFYIKAILGMANNLQPTSVAFFRGVLDYNTIGLLMTMLFKMMARLDGLGPGDYRNWEAIRLWTENTYSRL